jgi:hypothetical protein
VGFLRKASEEEVTNRPIVLKAEIMRDDEQYERMEKPWFLFLESPDGSVVREEWSPEPLVAYAFKWAKDRGVVVDITVFGVLP